MAVMMMMLMTMLMMVMMTMTTTTMMMVMIIIKNHGTNANNVYTNQHPPSPPLRYTEMAFVDADNNLVVAYHLRPKP